MDIDIASMNYEPKYFTLQRPRAFKDPQHLSVHDNFNIASGSFNLKIFRNQIIYYPNETKMNQTAQFSNIIYPNSFCRALPVVQVD